MGQTSSTQRESRRNSSLQFSLPTASSRNGHERVLSNNMSGQSGTRHIRPIGEDDTMNENSIEGSDPQQTGWPSAGMSTADHAGSEQEINYERDTRPLGEEGRRESRAASLARLAARRQSTMSRLGSRFLPNSVIRGLLNSEEETPAEGRAHRNGLVSRSSPRVETAHSTGRFTPFSSLSSRGITRRRSIRGPYALSRADAALLPDSPPNPAYFDSSAEQTPESSRTSWRRSARLSRVRNSISAPISQIFGQQSPPLSSQPPSTPPRRPSRSALTDDADHLLPPLGAMDTRMSFDEPPHELDSVEPFVRNPLPLSPTSSSRPSQGMTGIRRFPGVLRARSSRMLRREEQTPLSRVLQLAAAAIAAQLSGTAGPVLPNVQSLGNDGLDGSLENFIQSLQNATSAQTNPSGPEGASDQASDGSLPPVNFLRVFRFVNPETSGNSGSAGETPSERTDRMDMDEPAPEGSDGRTVTLVVVGVRSVPSSNNIGGDQQQQQNTTGPGLDTLLGLPLLPPSDLLRNQNGGRDLLRRADARSRFSPHRHLMGSANPVPVNNDSQRHRSDASRRPSDVGPSANLSSSLPTVLSESPPGPHPPPSTPAGLSAVSSGTSTPSRRPSSASAMSPYVASQSQGSPATQPTSESAEESTVNSARQRRRSDSEYARHRDLGSGAARRNGVVEPDNAAAPSGGRSWLIYVVGTNLSENHPAFATPSLFTDNPTYEDMILLSSLLGPAKPPVASQEDVSSAGGLFRLVEYGGTLMAEAEGGSGASSIPIAENERCLICLSDYEAAEELRQLTSCKHLYHKDCIDEWLTTGRNSCPLCRGQGVSESSNGAHSNPVQEAAA
ncbi:hypothetical protein DTO282E5_7808 [Paecilomyces variotii]|nr:hypothetical protein DTO282E5_7808 [Paecilomyces variotii]